MIKQQHRKWWIITAMSIMIVMVNIDFAAVNLALASIAKYFQASMAQIEWVITAFAITVASLIIIGGRLADLFGKRKLFIIGASIFIVSSFLAGTAINQWMLIFGRVLQGVGFAIVFPTTLAIAFSSFPKQQQGLSIGIIYGTAGLTQAIAPTIGGLIIQTLNWRWIFFLNIPVGILAIVLILLAYKQDDKSASASKIDYVGSALLATALFLIMFALNKISDFGINSIWFWLCLGGGLFFLLFFSWLEKTIKSPLLEFKLFHYRGFFSFTFIRLIIGYIYFTFMFLFGFFFQNILGYSPLHAGILMMLMTAVFGILSPFAGKWVDKIGIHLLLLVGLSVFIVAYGFLAYLPIPQSWHIFIFPFVAIGFALGISLPCISVIIMRLVPKQKTSSAAAILYANTFIGGALGVAITETLITKLNTAHLKLILSAGNMHLTNIQSSLLYRIVTGSDSIHSIHKYFNVQLSLKLITLLQTVFLHGFTVAMWVCVALSVLALSFAIMQKRSN